MVKITCLKCKNRFTPDEVTPYVVDSVKVYLCFECFSRFDPNDEIEEY